MLRRLPIVFAVFLWLLILPASDNAKLLEYRIAGLSSCVTSPCWQKAMERIEVQRLLLQLAASTSDAENIDSLLKGSGITREDLEKLQLIRKEQDRWALNFSLFTTEDIRKIREVSGQYAQSLADGFITRRQEIEAILGSYSVPGVDPKTVAFVLLGCVSLDWDGLNITARKGYRQITGKRPDGQYVPWAEEASAKKDIQNVYWGSHSDGSKGIQFTSFGDHYSLPRYSFPDLFWRASELKSLGKLPAVLMTEKSPEQAERQLGRIMRALHDRELTLKEMASAARITMDEAEAWAELLVRLEWIIAKDSHYRTRIPVFTKRDRQMIRHLQEIGREVISNWLAANYTGLKAELGNITPVRWGVPYAEGFTVIWHWVFGLANAELVKSGLFADPYDQGRKYKGFIPCVFETGAM